MDFAIQSINRSRKNEQVLTRLKNLLIPALWADTGVFAEIYDKTGQDKGSKFLSGLVLVQVHSLLTSHKKWNPN